MPAIWRTDITIYSKFDPQEVELSYLAKEAETGLAYCTRSDFIQYPDLRSIPLDDRDGVASFFNETEDDDD